MARKRAKKYRRKWLGFCYWRGVTFFGSLMAKKRSCARVEWGESNHSVYGALSNNLSHIGLEKQDRRLLLRIIWLNHDKHRKAAGDDVEKDDWPMPFLFEQQHQRWQ